jgi:tetratricopeptide (TPR) repeat protein/DNA-binding SARP family transcriptional activator
MGLPGLVSVAVLGPLEVSVGGRPLALTTGRLRRVLAALAISAGQVVPVDRLATAVWTGEQLPARPHAVVRMYVSRLRRMLGTDSITGSRSGYTLNVPSDQVDVLRFTRLLESAAAAPDEREHLIAALTLWRGTPFADVGSTWLERSVAPQLVERYLAAVERRTDLDIAAGRTDGLVAELRELTVQHPLRESLWVRLLTVLDWSGRQAEALAQYETIRVRLAEELGTDPGPALQQLHHDLLAGGTQPLHRAASATVVPPRQLPAPPQAFAGRARELAALEQVRDASTVVICAIDGMAGVGKTALAVQAAHRITDQYPDGQLFIDLHGYTPGVGPVEPGEALDRMLRALDIPGAQVPAGMDERAALYRTRLADQRMLIVLDNAATETQVAPLLPGTPGCLVLVTSRRRLAGLDHTRTLSLDTLPTPDAIALFVQTAGEGRLTDQPSELLAEIAELCDRLPLAIRVAAARLRSHPSWNLAHLVERLRHRQHRLRELEAGPHSVAAALDLSYQHLSPDQQRTYRLLGLHPGPDIDAYATAALLGSTPRDAHRILDQLLDIHLLEEPVASRYRFHDLTRAHAAHIAARDQTETATHAAVHRLLDYYRHTASVAMDAAYPYERERRPRIPPVHTAGPELPSPAAALGWLDTELPSLLACARYATERGSTEYVLNLSTILHRHLRTRGRYHDADALHQQALTIAHAINHRPGELAALIHLGDAHRRRSQPQQAAARFEQALRLARAIRDRSGEADALTGLGWVHLLQGRYPEAADRYGRAIRLARATGNGVVERDALTGLGQVHMLRGRYEQAADHYRQALRLARLTGDRTCELNALVGLSTFHRYGGRHEQAADHYRQALQLARATGHRSGEQNALTGLGWAYLLQGRYEEAADHYRQAIHLARATGSRTDELSSLTGLGQLYRLQGRYEQAADSYQQLLGFAQTTDDPNYEFEAWQGLGRLRHATGDPDAAIAYHERALARAGELGQPDDQARAHAGLAHAHHALNQQKQARDHWQRALDILTGLGIEQTDDADTTVAALRDHLAGLDEQQADDGRPES